MHDFSNFYYCLIFYIFFQKILPCCSSIINGHFSKYFLIFRYFRVKFLMQYNTEKIRWFINISILLYCHIYKIFIQSVYISNLKLIKEWCHLINQICAKTPFDIRIADSSLSTRRVDRLVAERIRELGRRVEKIPPQETPRQTGWLEDASLSWVGESPRGTCRHPSVVLCLLFLLDGRLP